MPDLRPLNYVSELHPGDVVRTLDSEDDYVVTAVHEGRAIAVRVLEVVEPSEFLHLPAGRPSAEVPNG